MRPIQVELTQPATRYTAGGRDREERAHEREEGPADHRLAEQEACETLVLAPEAVALEPLTTEGLQQRIPLTLSVSSVMVVMSARVRWVLVATSRRALPTFTVSQRNNGSSSSDRIVSGSESRASR